MYHRRARPLSRGLRRTAAWSWACAAPALLGQAPPVQAAAPDSGVNLSIEPEARFKVVEVQGTLLAWHPWEVEWRPLEKGATLFESTLIQSQTPGKLTLVRLNHNAKVENGETNNDNILEYRMPAPAMLRLHAQLTRKVSVRSILLDGRNGSIPSVKSAPNSNGGDKALVMAWRRVKSISALMTNLAADVASAFKPKDEAAKDGLYQSSDPPTIDLTQPKDGSLLVVDGFPKTIAVTWDAHQGKDKIPGFFNVYRWDTKAQRGRPAAQSDQGQALVTLPHAGSYFIQVESSDQTVQSAFVLVQAE